MKKFVYLLIISFLIISCHFPKYYFENSEMETGLDFTKGRWILNKIKSPTYEVNKILSDRAFKDFSKILQNRVSHSKNVKEFLITPNVNLRKNKSELLKIQKTTGFDYLIDVKAEILSNQMEAIDFTPSKLNMYQQNKVKIVIDIYDLKLQSLIYSKASVGLSSLDNSKSNSDINFTASTDMLIFGAYKKIMKDINKKSIH